MQDLIFGLIAIAAGAVFCFRGYLAFRVIIPIWGAFVGFGAGAGLVTAITGDGFLRTGISWIVGIGFALVFAVLAYLFYSIAVIIAMGSIGFALGTSMMVAFDVSWNWLVVLVGIIVGALLALVAIVGDLPMMLLIVLSALGGASAIVTGIMLLVGAVDTGDFDAEGATVRVDDDWWWWVLYGALAIGGIVSQMRDSARLRGTMRDAWDERRTA